MPITVDMRSSYSRGGRKVRERPVIPSLNRALERPHPTVVRAREALDDVGSKLGRTSCLQAQQLRRCAQRFFVCFPLDTGATVGEAQRKKWHEVQKRHPDRTV